MTQHDKILAVMGHNIGHWFKPQDFMRPDMGRFFVGYEASARLSELAKLYPDMIESKQDGKYKARRINPDPKFSWYSQLTPHVQKFINLDRVKR